MAERLKSILRRTSWSLVLKAILFGVAWWALPFWLFLIIALWLYFVPITGADKVAAPFFVLLLISIIQGQSILAAIIFAAVFYFILLVKDLIIIDRRSAYEVLMLVLSYLIVRSFFLNTSGPFGLRTLFYGLVAATAVSALALGFIKNFSMESIPTPFRRMLGWMVFLLMWQLLIVGSFLPLDFLYQSATIFLVAVILLDLVPKYVFGELSRVAVLATGTMLFALLVIVLSSARWVM